MPEFSTLHLDYLQRVGFQIPTVTTDAARLVMQPEEHPLFQVTRIGRFGARDEDASVGKRFVSEDALIALNESQLPLSFFIFGGGGKVSIHLGTRTVVKSAAPTAPDDLPQTILRQALNSLYPSVALTKVSFGAADLQSLPLCGLGVGSPSVKTSDPQDTAMPIDRIVRAMGDMRWAVLLLALPLPEAKITEFCNNVINELRAVGAAVQQLHLA